MRRANDCAPKTCLCGRKLHKPVYAPLKPYAENLWHIRCNCHRVFVWGWHKDSNGCWRERHELPLFDTKALIVLA